MRTYATINNSGGNVPSTCTITIPDEMVYLKDVNFITLQFTSNSPIRYIQVLITFAGKTYSASVYDSVMKFNLGNLFSDYFTSINGDEVVTMSTSGMSLKAKVNYSSSILSSTYNWTVGGFANFKIFDGYSLPNRSHGTDTMGFTPPAEIGSQCISMLATTNSLISTDKNTYTVEAGDTFQICAPEDGCMNHVDVTKLVGKKGWEKRDVSWAFGINQIVIDRVVIENDSLGIAKILEDNGFNTDYLGSRYSPVSTILEPTTDVGVWRVSFFSNVDDGVRHIVQCDTYDGRMFYLKEEGDRSLFAHDWNDPTYAMTAPQYKIYYAPIWHGDGTYEIYDYTPVDFTLRPYVAYDDSSYTDPNHDYTTFTETSPLCAIRFCTAMGYNNVNISDYDYVLHIDNFGGFDAYAQYWMFGNHLKYSNSKDPEIIEWFTTDPDAIYFYGTINEVGCGLNTLIPVGDNMDVPNGWYSLEIPNTLRHLLSHNNMWFQMWYFFNANVARYPQLYEWSWDDFSHTYVQQLNGARTYTKQIDTPTVLPDWTYGTTIINMYQTEITLRLTDYTILVTPLDYVQFFPVYSFNNSRVMYQTNLFPLFDGTNYYQYNGAIVTAQDADYVRITFDMDNYPDAFFNFDYTNDMLLIGNNISTAFECTGGVDCQYIRCMGTSMQTYAAFYYMPFVCGVPFVKLKDVEKSGQLSKINLVIEPAAENPDYDVDHQILQVERYYDTFVNVGSVSGQVNSGDISKGYTGDDKNLTVNTYIYSRFVNIMDMYSTFNWNPTLHIEDFNSYGEPAEFAGYYKGDGSFVLLDGCYDGEEAGGDIIDGDIYNYTAYSFNTCSESRIVWIKYKNMDGLWRYLPAEVIEQTYTNAKQDLQRIIPSESPINAYPLWKPYALEEKITVYLTDIPKDMHIEDMLYSTPLMLYSHDGAFPIHVSLEEDSIVRDIREDSENFVLHFIKKQ